MTMGHTYTSLHYHCVFSTLGRRNLIPQEILPRLHGYVAGIVRNLKGFPVSVGGTTNHVHVLAGLPANVDAAKAVGTVKANSSRWAHESFPTMSGFAWQEGYGAFTVSRSNLSSVADYISGQAEHHKTMSFEEEFLLLLKKHDIEYDERYIWG